MQLLPNDPVWFQEMDGSSFSEKSKSNISDNLLSHAEGRKP